MIVVLGVRLHMAKTVLIHTDNDEDALTTTANTATPLDNHGYRETYPNQEHDAAADQRLGGSTRLGRRSNPAHGRVEQRSATRLDRDYEGQIIRAPGWQVGGFDAMGTPIEQQFEHEFENSGLGEEGGDRLSSCAHRGNGGQQHAMREATGHNDERVRVGGV